MAEPKTPEEQQAEDRRRAEAVAAALAVGGTLAVGAAAKPDVPIAEPAKRAAVAAAILAGLVTFLATQRQRSAAWLRERLATTAAAPDAIEQVIAEELQREETFAQRSAARMQRDLTTSLSLPDQASREASVRGVMQREERYARQRSVAMAARAFAAVDRVVLRTQSPNGAFWKLDPDVQEHTAGCLLMGGKFWPWPVLDRVHPPRHPGCPCRLISYAEAITEGLLAPGNVQDVRVAVRRAAHVVMEAQMFSAEVDDIAPLRDLLFEAHLIGMEDQAVERGILTPAAVAEAREGLLLGLPLPEALAELEVGLGRDRSGFFVYSPAARSESFASLEEIAVERAHDFAV